MVKLLLSGGGFRATLFHLGVVRYLREAGKLPDVRAILSVSGGSILAAHLALNWDKYCGSETLFQEAAAQIVGFTQADVRGKVVRRCLLGWSLVAFFLVVPPSLFVFLTGYAWWSLLLAALWVVAVVFFVRAQHQRWSFISLLQSQYANLYRVGNQRTATLQDVSSANRPTLILLATNLTTGGMAYFDARGVAVHAGEGEPHYFPREHLPLALGVAASSAFPPLFSPVVVTRRLVAADARDLQQPQYLCDGGVFDNLGIRAALSLDPKPQSEVLISNAERRFDWAIDESFGLLPQRATRSTDILMHRLSSLELAAIKPECTVRIASLQEDVEDSSFLSPALQKAARNIRTDLDRFSPLEIQLLFYRGYGAARMAFEGSSDPLREVSLSERGVPLSAQPPRWLPITGNHPGLLVDPESALRRGEGHRWGVWRWSDATSWLTALMLALTTFLCLPVLVLAQRAYYAVPATPFALKATIARTANPQGSKILFEHGWVLPHLQALRAPSLCATTTQALVLTDVFGGRTLGRPTKDFQLVVAPRLGIKISDAEAFLLSGKTGSFVPLASEQRAGQPRTVHVPSSGPSERVLLVMLLCDERAGSVLESQPLDQVLDLQVKEVEP